LLPTKLLVQLLLVLLELLVLDFLVARLTRCNFLLLAALALLGVGSIFVARSYIAHILVVLETFR